MISQITPFCTLFLQYKYRGGIAHNDSCSASGHIEVTARRSTIIKMLIQQCCSKGQRYRYAEGVRENALWKRNNFKISTNLGF